MIIDKDNPFIDTFLKLRTRFFNNNGTHEARGESYYSELFNESQLENHGKILARAHKLQTGKTAERLLGRLDENEKILLEVRRSLVESVQAEKNISPAAVWLLDNFYLIEDHIAIARKHLPKGYSKGLPFVLNENSGPITRIYDIVEEIISHSDGRADIKGISSFVAAYQSEVSLTLGELWAIPIMLRLAVIENLRRVANFISMDMVDHDLADYWADEMLQTLKDSPGNLILTVADMARSKPELSAAFVASFVRKLQGKGTALSLPLNWLEQQLATAEITIGDLIPFETQKQASDQISISNSIGTLRFIATTDWAEFVETLSSVEQVLQRDITGNYGQMDFATRDRYRKVVESISKASRLSETQVAQKAHGLSVEAKQKHPNDSRQHHIGYFLIDKGLKLTEKEANLPFSVRRTLKSIAGSVPVLMYITSIAIISFAGSAGILFFAYDNGLHNKLLLFFTALLSIAGIAHLAVSLVNWLATLAIPPALLPRMDFSKGIPPEYRTLVVVPTMLSDAGYIDELLEGLEVRYLANTDANLHFGLLTDFLDADSETLPGDEALVNQAIKGIRDLNEKYATNNENIFFLFHRMRTWNKKEKKWMGFERKRGKISSLNALLRNRSNHEFSVIVGDVNILSNVKYVISLDSDTRLPRETAWKLIGTMAHPLNTAIYSEKKKQVIAGYGILQPRIEPGMPPGRPTMYLQMQGQLKGIDPYTLLTSEVYQDLFGEGSYIGKGIYDVDTFEQTLHNRFPDNRILSHDLIEGCYCRSGLISNVVLYDDSPATYEEDVKRHHRWVRGDWQIGTWMLPFITNRQRKLKVNTLSLLSRWKIMDNLRRSLLPLSLMLLLLLGWFILPLPWLWTITVTLIVMLTEMAAAGRQLLNRPHDVSLKAHIQEMAAVVTNIFIRFIFYVAVLPFQAYRYTHAVLLANWRLTVSKKNLLKWTPSAAVAKNNCNALVRNVVSMWIAPTLGIGCLIGLAYTNIETLMMVSPILTLWILAPVLAWKFSEPIKEENKDLSKEQTMLLQQTARKTWGYFERFFSEEDNWLPPDNYQEEPANVIAHRTSPTNMGMALLANLAAYDFGYITGSEMAGKCALTLDSMQKLERFRGHFYNWYSTITLEVLRPYISTVDSGNLIAHLLTLKQGLLALPNDKLFSANLFEGLYITACIIADAEPKKPVHEIEKIKNYLLQATEENIGTYSRLKEKLDAIQQMANALAASANLNQDATKSWITRFENQIKSIIDDLDAKVPWLNLLPIPEKFTGLRDLDTVHPPLHMQQVLQSSREKIKLYQVEENNMDETNWLRQMDESIAKGSRNIEDYLLLLNNLAVQCESMTQVSYNFLFNKATSLLTIGYNTDEHKQDNGYYDLMASEARLGIFTAIAQGKLPQKSWFALGRLLTGDEGDPILLSWSGSMFEYLMPQLVMPEFENTLLHQTNVSVIKKQIAYAAQREVPWGISESGYYVVDANLNYQYKAFGVPGLGLKRGLGEDLVIAPYATMLALMVAPKKACNNLQTLKEMGATGEFGYYEAIDFTTSRLQREYSHAIVQSYMVHHQGMGLLSLAYVLLDKPMQKRFTSELRFKATLLLLQERVPRTTMIYEHTDDVPEAHAFEDESEVRRITTPNTLRPEVQLLSNGRYRVMITNGGGGYSRWKDIAINRWREDATKDNRGIFCYIKDVDSGKIWSNTYQPTLQPAGEYEALFSQGHVEFRRKDSGIETLTEIVVSPEDDTEMRRICITNRSGVVKELEITSYAEVVMASQESDEGHQVFSNLFVQTKIVPEHQAIISTRRPRSSEENPPWLFHRMDVQDDAVVEAISYETDRLQFIGRGRTLVHPQALDQPELSGKEGAVLDPIMAIRYRIKIKPNKTATFSLIYGISETKEGCEAMMRKYADTHLKKRAFELSWTHNQVLLRQINATESEAQLYTRLASSVIFSNPSLRAHTQLILSNLASQPGLWSQSVSGDLPIILLHIHDQENIEIVKQLVKAHAYWRLKGLAVDLVIWNENPGSYRQQFHERIQELITTESVIQQSQNKQGNIFLKTADQLSTEERILFESVAKIILHDSKGSLSEQVNMPYTQQVLPALLEPKKIKPAYKQAMLKMPDDLLFFNGTGGFAPDGKEYKIITGPQQSTPAPWVNILANRHFGTVVSESGAAYTWALNAHEYRITPWRNDPVIDSAGEAFYMRDEETGEFWSPTPYPAMGSSPYITTHGFGYSLFEHIEDGIASHLSVFVDKEFPIKCFKLTVQNQSGRERTLSATGYMEIIMGDVRSKTTMHTVSELDPITNALFFKNRFNPVFAERIGFFKLLGITTSHTADRSIFIGRNGTLENPDAMSRKKLSGKTGAAIDPCAALQVKFDLLHGEEREIIFVLGNESNLIRAKDLLTKFSDKTVIQQSFDEVKAYWQNILTKVQLNTPDPALNILSNGWLTYQTIACRIFARSGFYQSGGGFGFRDQLQDVLALLHTEPGMAREQIILHASRQFTEGDVQHWWHPPEGRGVRTRCSDDLLWMPYTVARYVQATGDNALLEEKASFLESRILHPEEDSFFDLPMKSNQTETVYEHCVRAINHSMQQYGVHGLPLMGAGDWNDGMDKVGNLGKGESVWLGFFLYEVLIKFAPVAEIFGDEAFSAYCKKEAIELKKNLEASAWDGEWYMRAWFDDGTPLGSKSNTECRIDSITQSWSVISEAGNIHRQHLAMQSVETHLVDRKLSLIKLLTPSFDKTPLNPGYIKGYVPGVRENGGQYSHAAIWALMAFAKLADRQKTWELFNMIQPIGHSTDGAATAIYKVEPYVMAADVYANEQHPGRGGWTWYTGSAGWMYQFITGSLVGMKQQGNELHFNPCFPVDWPFVTIHFNHEGAMYNIKVYQVAGDKNSWHEMDNETLSGSTIQLNDDGRVHEVSVHCAMKV